MTAPPEPKAAAAAVAASAAAQGQAARKEKKKKVVGPMEVHVIGLSIHTASVDVREKLAIPEDRWNEASAALCESGESARCWGCGRPRESCCAPSSSRSSCAVYVGVLSRLL
jgi:hypothetical protein